VAAGGPAGARRNYQEKDALLVMMVLRDRGKMEAAMPVILWLMGVPLLVVIALVVTHVI
jgi:hypothetical protein